MSNIYKAIKHFFSCSMSDKIDIVYILFIGAWISLLVKYIPIKYYYSHFFASNKKCPQSLQPFMRKIGIVYRIFSFLPWKVSCLVECMIVKQFLLKYDVCLKINLGVILNNGMEAHAWYDDSLSNGFQQNILVYEKE